MTVVEELLAAELSPLVGRDQELAALRGALSTGRLVTVTGPGGVGKTKLALAATGRRSRLTVRVELAGLAAGAPVVGWVCAAAGVRTEPGVPPVRSLAAVLDHDETLLLLDNCEHVRETAADLCAELLAGAPRLTVLATSRAPLGVPGEVVFDLSPLSLGPDGDAVRLFLDRAERASRGFADAAAADPPRVAEIARLCAELDGLPLAIELAAARARMLPISQITGDLERRLDVLAGGRAGLPRHRSVRASIEWSASLLSDSERELFERLSVFAGGWPLEGAEAVCEEPPMGGANLLDLLGLLADRSLIFVEPSGAQARFGMLVTVQAFAAERLASRPSIATAVRAAHASWCAKLVERAESELMGRGQSAALAALDREADNVLAAIEWAERGDRDVALRIAAAMALYWHARGRFADGRRILEPLTDGARDAPADLRARALWALGLMLVSAGELDAARPVIAEARGRARDCRQPGLEARALNLEAELDLMTDPKSSLEVVSRAIELARAAGDTWCLADALGKLGAAALYRSDAGQARPAFEECLEIARAAGDERALHRALGGLARVTAIEGGAENACRLLRESLSISERLGDRAWTALDLAMLGELERLAGRPADGATLAERGLALAEEIDAVYPRYLATGILGRIAQSLEDPETAEVRFRAALALAERDRLRPFRSWWQIGLAEIALGRGELDQAAIRAQDALASAGASGNRRDAARATALLGRVALRRQEHEVAIGQLATALALHRDVGDEPAARRSLEALQDAFARSGQTDRAARIAAALARPDGFEEAVALALRGRGGRRAGREAGWGGLTRAEAEVAELAAAGASNPEIAARLFMSRSTVKTHLSRVFAKLGVANRTELAAAVLDQRDRAARA